MKAIAMLTICLLMSGCMLKATLVPGVDAEMSCDRLWFAPPMGLEAVVTFGVQFNPFGIFGSGAKASAAATEAAIPDDEWLDKLLNGE